jgi:hypothetical protein
MRFLYVSFVQTLVCTFHCAGIVVLSVVVVNTDSAFGMLPLYGSGLC